MQTFNPRSAPSWRGRLDPSKCVAKLTVRCPAGFPGLGIDGGGPNTLLHRIRIIHASEFCADVALDDVKRHVVIRL